MPVTLPYILPVGRIIKDAGTGKFSFIDVYSIIYIPKGQTRTTEFITLAGRFENIPGGSATVEVFLQNRDGQIIASQILTGANLAAGSLDFQANLNLVEFTAQGLYFIHVKYNGVIIPDENRNSIFVYQIV